MDLEKWLDENYGTVGSTATVSTRRNLAREFFPLIEAARCIDAAWLNGEGRDTGHFAGEMSGLRRALRDLGVLP